jgi:hypothetical protein
MIDKLYNLEELKKELKLLKKELRASQKIIFLLVHDKFTTPLTKDYLKNRKRIHQRGDIVGIHSPYYPIGFLDLEDIRIGRKIRDFVL